MPQIHRRIPFNYTSADDRQVITHLLGKDIFDLLSVLEQNKGTGRSSRLLHRFMGDMFILERNAFLFQELITHPHQRKQLFDVFENDLSIIEKNAQQPEVFKVLAACRDFLNQRLLRLKTISSEQKKILHRLCPIVGRENIYFDAFNITAHTTDATDWRLYPPLAVVRPSHVSQVPKLIWAIRKLGLHIIPRGAGTGLTGGATPLTPTCVMVNTEKLNRLSEIEYRLDASGRSYAQIRLEAGVITNDAMEAAEKEGFIFATDPTSSWACTIGGNIAENAGGKTAVLFGTAIDNLLSYEMVLPDGRSVVVQRKNHPLRKIQPEDRVVFEVLTPEGDLISTIAIAGTDIRKKGLGKDVTNKTLNGLPGIQKEGCDGVITAGTFILYPRFAFKKTVCIEFFGDDMAEASQVISQMVKVFTGTDPALIALEHFDEEYIRAIDYKIKTSVHHPLKAVLLVDMVSNSMTAMENGIQKLDRILENFEMTGLSIAGDEKEAVRYWQDRKKLGAIAAHTNAFKLNEDIVLPIDALTEFSRYIDQYNVSEKKFIQKQIINQIIRYLDTAIPLDDPQWLETKVSHARGLAFKALEKLEMASKDALEAWIHPKNFYTEVKNSLRGYSKVSGDVDTIYNRTRSRLIVIATHMHAGDGNVHVNIPVFSNDLEMMSRAAAVADHIMTRAIELNGVVSGEHGIGLTKIKHLDEKFFNEFMAYRQKIDPERLMNPKKLADPDIMDKVYTPSFNLLKLEASILRHGALEELASNIANCVRCGRCKKSCPVFYPTKNLFYHPRNKNLATGALIEALMYIVQRTQSTGFRILTSLEEIADHCTVCHKCLANCPVKIDSGLISIAERDILAARDFKHRSVSTRVVLNYLSSRNPLKNAVVRNALLLPGSRIQPLASRIAGPFRQLSGLKNRRVVQLLHHPVTPMPVSPLHAFLPELSRNQVLMIEPENQATHTVFYFPGCGSERLFSDIARAGIFMLLQHQVRVILPPPFLCCGYPAKVNARDDEFKRLSLQASIIFSQIKEMFLNVDFDACVVSCGTCMEALNDLGIQTIFDTRLEDIFGFLKRVDNAGTGLKQGFYLYHCPCHDSLNGNGAALLAGTSAEHSIVPVPHCCSEAGTLAISRPDIANALLHRKADILQNTVLPDAKETILLTNCPSCIQGLSRHRFSNIRVSHILVELARQSGSGPEWKKQFETLIRCSEVINF